MMILQTFLEQLAKQPDSIAFNDTIALIMQDYNYTPCAFDNGSVNNAAGSNEGSCKIFAFAQHQQLDAQQTLQLFGQYYQDVLNNPQGTDHQNIRQFIIHGWSGVHFHGQPLSRK